MKHPYHDVINDPAHFVPTSTNVTEDKRTYGSAREAHNATCMYTHPYMTAQNSGTQVRSLYTLRRSRPYVERLYGPDGHGLAPDCASMRNTRGFSDVYHLTPALPPAMVVHSLQRAGWSAPRIDAAMPRFLYDRRMDAHAASTALRRYMNDTDFKMMCPWRPHPITRTMVRAGTHVRYCSMVCRLYLLETLSQTLRDEHASYSRINYSTPCIHAFDMDRQNASEENAREARDGRMPPRHDARVENDDDDVDTKKRALASAIKEVGKWQDSMIGTALYMEESGRFADADFEAVAADGRRGPAHHEIGLHWVLHVGELPDISMLVPHLAYWSPVEQLRHSKNVRGRSTEAGAIGQMRGTPFQNDPFVCSLLRIVKHGMPQPSQLRNADWVIVQMLRELMGRDDSEADQALVARNEFNNIIDVMCDLLEEHVDAHRELDAATRRSGKYRGQMRDDALRRQHSWLVQRRADLLANARHRYERLTKFNNTRIAESDAARMRAVRSNKKPLSRALLSAQFEDAVQYGRKFLGLPEFVAPRAGADPRSEDDELELYRDVFGDTQVAHEMSQSAAPTVQSSVGAAASRGQWTPKWSAVKERSVVTGDISVATGRGGHNAHRLLDFMLRVLGVTLLGGYELCAMRPEFFTCKEVYRFVQYDAPSIEEFCAWIETPFPEDLEKHAAGVGKSERDEDGIPHKYRNGSDYRRYFIVYMMREYHLHSVRQLPGYWKRFEELYRWDCIVRNITETCDALRFFVNNFVRDYYMHAQKCDAMSEQFLDDRDACAHCVRWEHVERHFTPRLLRLYRRWPILFAVDMASRWRVDPATGVTAADVKYTFAHNEHNALLRACWRASMRSFANIMYYNFAHMDQIMRRVDDVRQAFTPKPTKRHQLTAAELDALSRDAVTYFRRAEHFYERRLEEPVRRSVRAVITRSYPQAEVGYDWLMMWGVNIGSLALVHDAQRRIESEVKRSKAAYYTLLSILAKHGMDYFVLRTFYYELVQHNKMNSYPLDAATVRAQVRAVAKRVGTRIAPCDRPLPAHVTRFYVCTVHDRLNASIVGTELGDDATVKNTRCYGHSGISVDLANDTCGAVFCTTSGKRADRRGASDQFWRCVRRPNRSVDLLGQAFKLNDVIYALCLHCGNPMELRWERFCCGDLRLWCGQCPEGMKRMALQRGLVWMQRGAVTPRARSNYIGGLPVLATQCMFCRKSRESCEGMEYVLVYDDTDPSGVHRLGYVPTCRDHKRPYAGESWRTSCLRFLRYVHSRRLCTRNVGMYTAAEKWPYALTKCSDKDSDEEASWQRGRVRVPMRIFMSGKNTPDNYELPRAERNRRENRAMREELSADNADGDVSERNVRRARRRGAAKRALTRKLKERAQRRQKKRRRRK